jgi:excisionase family DNA binding protein
MHVDAKPETPRTHLLTRREAAAFLRISERTLFTLTERGTLPSVRIGVRVLYSMKSLQAFIDKAEELSSVGQ